jgi:hypothetical protein
MVSRAALFAFALPILSGALSNPAIAATRTSSMVVSVTVAAGCQVSSALSQEQRAAAAPGAWSAPVAVSCSLPVAYQVDVTSGSSMNLSANEQMAYLDSLRALSLQSNSLQSAQSMRAGTKPTWTEPASSSAADGSLEVADGPAQGPDPGAVTVTIVY